MSENKLCSGFFLSSFWLKNCKAAESSGSNNNTSNNNHIQNRMVRSVGFFGFSFLYFQSLYIFFHNKINNILIISFTKVEMKVFYVLPMSLRLRYI